MDDVKMIMLLEYLKLHKISLEQDADRLEELKRNFEGDTPTRVHIRTEVPYVQSSDIIDSEFIMKELVTQDSYNRMIRVMITLFTQELLQFTMQ